jgi:phospholipid/cholesterol/gamma-HCH transport system substrate-binding protein
VSNSRTMLQMKRYGRSFMILVVLALVGIVAGFYILSEQRLPNPFTKYYKVNAAFPTAAAVVPGLGEPVDVAGVHVGQILNTVLHAGQGVIQMEIDPTKGVPHLYRNAYAVLTPNTPLKDMYVDIYPGSKSHGVLPNGGTIPISDTTSPIDSDELLDELDLDTRDWFTSLITSLSTGTQKQGPDLKKVLETLGPTAQQTHQITQLLANRRTEIASLVHNLGVLTKATSVDDTQLGQVVQSGNTTIQALASQDGSLERAVKLLPGTLATTRSTFADLTNFANELTPTAQALVPIAQHLPKTLTQARTLIKTAALLPTAKIKSFEQTLTPLASKLVGLDSGLKTDVPPLTTAFKGLEYITNEVAYDPGNGNPGFLYWLAWFAHNADSFVGNTDANGSAWRTLLMTTCSSLDSVSPTVKTLVTSLLGSFGCT